MAYRSSLFLAFLPTRSRTLLRLRGRLAYKSQFRSISSPQSLPVCGTCVVPGAWNRSGREDGVYQPVSTSSRAWAAEGRAASAGACKVAAGTSASGKTPRSCGERRQDGLAAPDKGTRRRRADRGVAGGTEPSAFLRQRPRSFSHPGTTV